MDDIKTAHNCLFFQTATFLVTDSECSDIPQKLITSINNELKNFGIPEMFLKADNNIHLDTLARILAKDLRYRSIQNEKNISILKEQLNIIGNISNDPQNIFKLIELNRSLSFPVTACDILAQKIAAAIKSIYNDKITCYKSDLLQIPIYFGEGNEYNCYVQFEFQNNTIMITLE